MLEVLPRDAYYIFCQANIPRALPANRLADLASAHHLRGEVVPDVNQALERARTLATPDDFIFVGGSTFVVAELKDL
jgi:dihydrofolate synthase/folylpolyglutamate synthase